MQSYPSPNAYFLKQMPCPAVGCSRETALNRTLHRGKVTFSFNSSCWVLTNILQQMTKDYYDPGGSGMMKSSGGESAAKQQIKTHWDLDSYSIKWLQGSVCFTEFTVQSQAAGSFFRWRKHVGTVMYLMVCLKYLKFMVNRNRNIMTGLFTGITSFIFFMFDKQKQ